MSGIRYKAKANGLAILRGKWISAWLILVFVSLLTYGITALEEGYRRAFDVDLNQIDWQSVTSFNQLHLTPKTFIITGVAAVITILLVSPLRLGKTEWYWKLSENKAEGVSTIFAWFSSLRLYAKSVLLLFNIALRAFLWSLLIFAVPVGMLGGAYYLDTSNPSENILLVAAMIALVGFLLLLGALFLLLVITSRYYLAAYLFVEDNTRGINEVVRQSVTLTKGYRGEIVKFILSFLLWFLIGFITLVGELFVDPYYSASSVIFARHIIFTRRAALRGPEAPDGKTIEFDTRH